MENAEPVKLGICRVIGNELPPRDRPGGKLASLRYILENEKGVERVWVLNHLHDPEYRQQVTDLLVNRQEPFVELRFDPRYYLTLCTIHERVRYAVNVNLARNLAIELTRRDHDFAVSLDQNCFFTPDLWEQLACFIREDQRKHPTRRYYGLMMKRLLAVDPAGAADMPDEEPQLIFRRDSPALFN